MADTTINPPSSSLKLYYRVARFAWENGEQYLCFTSDHYFRLPSSHIYEICENFLCWETEWMELPAHRSAAEAASISILSSGGLCSDAVAANERSESATPVPLSSHPHSTSHSTSRTHGVKDESATGPKLIDTADGSDGADNSATGSPVPAEDTCVAPIYYTQQMLDELEHAAYMSEAEIIYMADCAVAEVLARIEAALKKSGSSEWFYIYWDDRLTISAFRYNKVASGITDDYGTVIDLQRNAYLQHFTYTH